MRAKTVAAIAALPLLSIYVTGCGPTLDELKNRPALFTTETPIAYDTMANCLVTRSMDDYLPSPQIYADRGVAYVTLSHRSAMTLQGEYTIRRIASGSSVEFRQRELAADLGGSGKAARAAVESCSKP